MADSLVNGHKRPSLDRSASCSSYYSLGMRWKEAGLAARLPVQIYCNSLDISGKGVQAGRRPVSITVLVQPNGYNWGKLAFIQLL